MTQLHDLLDQPAFALIRIGDGDTVTLLGGERTDVEEQLGSELGLVGEVRVDVDAVGVAARLPPATVEVVLAVLSEAFRESLPQTLVGDDQVYVVADLAADARVRRPPSDEDRGLEVVPERVQQSAKAALIVCPENRHCPSPS